MSSPRCEPWTEDEIETGILIFGVKTCAHCKRELPACTDYFKPDIQRADGFTGQCRECCRERDRARWQKRTHGVPRGMRREAFSQPQTPTP